MDPAGETSIAIVLLAFGWLAFYVLAALALRRAWNRGLRKANSPGSDPGLSRASTSSSSDTGS
jgi:hypothetical protein